MMKKNLFSIAHIFDIKTYISLTILMIFQIFCTQRKRYIFIIFLNIKGLLLKSKECDKYLFKPDATFMSLLMQSFSEGGPDSVLAIISMPVRFENTTGTLTASHCPIVVFCQYCCFGWQTRITMTVRTISCWSIFLWQNHFQAKWEMTQWLRACVCLYVYVCARALTEWYRKWNPCQVQFCPLSSPSPWPTRYRLKTNKKKAMCILSSLLSSSSPPHPLSSLPSACIPSIHVSPVARVAV